MVRPGDMTRSCTGYEAFGRRSLADRDYVYVWADGVDDAGASAKASDNQGSIAVRPQCEAQRAVDLLQDAVHPTYPVVDLYRP